ncbi:hypothetical protein AtNW77_Chr5g0088321 [Arabidopsis thaliana]
MKGSIHDSAITGLEAQLMASKRGLIEAPSGNKGSKRQLKEIG